MLNAISVDVEEYFHAANLEPLIGPALWHAMASRVEPSTRIVLEIMSRTKTRGTFFILGSVARRHPNLVREIAAQGHEIASHGYGHRLAYRQTERAFFRDVYRTKRLLEDLSGQIVRGYRAPNFSITAANEWAYDALIRAGYEYDSSLYPIWHPRYANVGKRREIHELIRPKGKLTIVPLTTTKVAFAGKVFAVPVAGGAYWRLFPRFLLRWGLRRVQRVEGRPCVCYLHPWEVDIDQPRVAGLNWLTSIRHYAGTQALQSVLDRFLNEFPFGTIQQVLDQRSSNPELAR